MNKVIFLDRDGTINKDFGYVYKLEQLEFIPGVVTALKRLQDAEYKLVIITNQSGIGRGYYTQQQYDDFMMSMMNRLKDCQVLIDAVYMCPHIEADKCKCRKPKLKLYYDAADKFAVNWKESYAIGDKERDLAICKEQQVSGILLNTEAGNETKSTNWYKICQSWNSIADYILKESE